MSKIDLKDKKILYELDLNCRQSNTQIGKKVGLKKDVVSYRIKKLQEAGIIKNFYAAIDTYKLGYNVFRIYINLRYVSPKLKEEIIKYFIDEKNSWVVASVKTEIDLAVVMWVKNLYEFYQFWEKALDKYEDYFEKYTISIYIYAVCYKKSFLLIDENIEVSNGEMYRVSCGVDPVEIDETDYKLLNELADNGRAPLIELAGKFGCSSQNVNYRINKLVKSGVINAFRVNIDETKLGLHRYKVDIYLKDHNLKKPVFNYLNKKSYIEYMNLAMGWSDLEPEFVVKDMDELSKILEELNSKFSGAVKKQSFFIVERFHKLRCLPVM